MKRVALLIGYPGEVGDERFLKGVEPDVHGWMRYLKSPVGGLWRESEIHLVWAPARAELQALLDQFRDQVDYAFVTFSGHGALSECKNDTLLQINRSEFFSSALLEIAKRQTILLDCCREPVETEPRLGLEQVAVAADKPKFPNPGLSRKAFDLAVGACSEMVLTAHACAPGECSYDDKFERGGVYTYELLEVLRNWHAVGLAEGKYRPLSMVQAHNKVLPAVTSQNKGLQNPKLGKPRADKYLPIAVWV